MTDVRVEKVNKTFGEKQVFNDFSAVFPAGRVSCITAMSGAGKTTLLNMIMGLEKPDSGTIAGADAPIAAVFQEDRLFEDFSALTNVKACSNGKGPDPAGLLSELGLGAELNEKVKNLSGGMKRRVAIARALAADCPLVLMDEPFKGLDDSTREKCIAVVKKYCVGKTVILVTHDSSDISAIGGLQVDF